MAYSRGLVRHATALAVVVLAVLLLCSTAEARKERSDVLRDGAARVSQRMRGLETENHGPVGSDDSVEAQPFPPHRHGNHSGGHNYTDEDGHPHPFFPRPHHHNESRHNFTDEEDHPRPFPFFRHRRHGNHSGGHNYTDEDGHPRPFFPRPHHHNESRHNFTGEEDHPRPFFPRPPHHHEEEGSGSHGFERAVPAVYHHRRMDH